MIHPGEVAACHCPIPDVCIRPGGRRKAPSMSFELEEAEETAVKILETILLLASYIIKNINNKEYKNNIFD